MTRLALVTNLVGSAIVLTRLPGVVAPAKFREHMLQFPRSVFWGRVLISIAAVWVGIVMFNAATEDWAWARPLIVIGLPVAYWLLLQFGKQYLAVRGTAALMLLVAKIIVDAADRVETPVRLVMTVLAYLWVVAAIWMTSAPHHLRDLLGYLMANDQRCRVACYVSIAVGVVLIGLGTFVY